MSPWFLANVVAVCIFATWTVYLAVPSTKGVRIRNALLLSPAEAEEFEWTPVRVPHDYVVEHADADDRFRSAVERAGVNRIVGDWPRGLALANWLCEFAKDKGPIQSGLDRTLAGIEQGFGYCADFVKVYLALAYAAGIFARQWSFSFDGFGGHGHTLVEIYDHERGKWLMIDVFNNFYAADAQTGEPLSAMEFRSALQGKRNPAKLTVCGSGRPGYTIVEKAMAYYRRGVDQWYMSWGNAVFSYDRHPLVGLAGRVSGTLGQIVATAIGIQPIIRPLRTDTNRSLLEKLDCLRQQARIAIFGGVGFTLLLLAQGTLAATKWSPLA